MDQIDRKIVAELRKNARTSITDLAAKIGLSKTPVINRIKKLEKQNVILGYTAIIDPVKQGLGHIAFVQVTLNNTTSKTLNAFNKAVLEVPEISQCHLIAASFDYLLKVRTADITDFRTILGERISTLPHVTHTSTFVAMEAVKDIRQEGNVDYT